MPSIKVTPVTIARCAMLHPIPNVRRCEQRKGWCVEDQNLTHGPLESEAEARAYALLLKLVNSARSQIACTDEVCWQ